MRFPERSFVSSCPHWLAAIVLSAALLLSACSTQTGDGSDPSAAPASPDQPAAEPVWTAVERPLLPVTTDNADRILLLDKNDQSLVAYDAAGEELWAHDAPMIIHDHPLVVSDAHRVYVQSADGWSITALDWATGDEVWQQDALEGAGCVEPPPMILTSNEVLNEGGDLVGLGLATYMENDCVDAAPGEMDEVAVALDPVNGDVIGKPLELSASRIEAGTTITHDGAGLIVFGSDGMSAELNRLDLTDGTSTGVGLNHPLSEAGVLPGDTAAIEDAGDDNLVFDFAEGPTTVLSIDEWATGNEPGTVSVAAASDDPVCYANSEVTRTGGSYCVLAHDAASDSVYEFALYDDGAGTSGDIVSVPAPDGVNDRGMSEGDAYSVGRILIPSDDSAGPRFVVPGADAPLVAYDAVTGDEEWQSDSAGDFHGEGPHVLEGTGEVAVTLTNDSGGDVHTLIVDAATGEERERREGGAISLGDFVVISAGDSTEIRGVPQR